MSDATLSFEEAMEKYDPVLGFEVHVELNTKTKMFSSAPNVFGDEPNTNVNEVDLGMPGVLPVVNRTAIESSIKIGLALNCKIAETCRFARKNYFYPDTPKNFQTSQYDEPIAYDGYLDIELSDGTVFRVEIERAHMEEDAGKLTHMGGAAGRIQGADYSLVDYNRSGVPLVEIVTKPIEGAGSRAPELAKAYVAAVREIVKNLGVSDAKMERGNVRCDANVSLRPHGRERFGIRSETKNVNSLRAVEHAVHYEIQRHAAVLDSGEPVIQETRHWHEDTRSTTSGRPKSDADDYRYFPEPDLVPIVASREWVEELRATLPEPPAARRKRLQADWGYSDLEFRDVVNAGVMDEIEETIAAGATATVARKWWMGEIVGRAKNADVDPGQLGVAPATIVELNKMVEDGKINNKMATEVLDGVLAGEGTPAEIVEKRGLAVVSDDGPLLEAIDAALAAQPGVADKIRGGKIQAIGAIVGGVMKATRGQADAGRVRELILERLGVEGYARLLAAHQLGHDGLQRFADHHDRGAFKVLRTGQDVDPAPGADAFERPQHNVRVQHRPRRVPGQQPDHAPGRHQRGHGGVVVDPVHDVQFPAGDGRDGGEHVRGGVAGAAGHPGFADDVVRRHRPLAGQPVPGRQRDVQRFVRERDHRDALLGPARAVVHPVRQHQVVPGRQRREVLLRHVLVGEQDPRLPGPRQQPRKRRKQGLPRAVEAAQRHRRHRRPVVRADRRPGVRHGADDGGPGVREHLPRLGEDQVAALLAGQRDLHRFLQRGQLLRHRGRRNQQGFGDRLDAAEGARVRGASQAGGFPCRPVYAQGNAKSSIEKKSVVLMLSSGSNGVSCPTPPVHRAGAPRS